MRPKPFWALITITALVLILPFLMVLLILPASSVSVSCAGEAGETQRCTAEAKGRTISYTCKRDDCDAARQAALRAEMSLGERVLEFIGRAFFVAFYPLEVLLILAGIVTLAYERGWVRQRPTT